MNKPAFQILLEALQILLEDLQNAKEGSRELSDRCLLAVGYAEEDLWINTDGPKDPVNPPNPSCNAQDALDCMVPEGWHLDDMCTYDPDVRTPFGQPRATLFPNMNNYQGKRSDLFEASAPTLSLAICSARIQQLIGECDD